MILSGIFPLLMGAIGLALSAFFSGSETGLYRASRVRLRLEAVGGDPLARLLLWLVNRPGLFIATALVGNNLANNLVSLAVVLFGKTFFTRAGHAAELILTALLAPMIFVYGELLPKYLFLRAPNRLLRRGGPIFLFFTLLFLPVSIFIWGINFLADRFFGGSAQPVRFRLARRELRRILEDAHEVGVLQPVQRRLADAIFALADLPVRRFAQPLENFPRVRSNMSKQEVLDLVSDHLGTDLLIEDAGQPGALLGYVQAWELALQTEDLLAPIHPLLFIPSEQGSLEALVQMERSKARLAVVLDSEGKILGVLSLEALRGQLLGRTASSQPFPGSEDAERR